MVTQPHSLPDAKLETEKLDDVMLAMDVVDTLRHEHSMTARDLAAEDRRTALIERLRGIYAAQGIAVPDTVLMDGVLALEQQRFTFTPPKPGLGTKLAKIYIYRRRWLPLIYMLVFIIGSVLSINYVGFVRPAQVQAAQTQTLLTETLPQQLSAAREQGLALAATDTIKDTIERLYQSGQNAVRAGTVKPAQDAIEHMTAMNTDLAQDYTLRIVSRPGESSGIFRLNDDIGAENVKNFYLIVEAISPTGETLSVRVTSEEDQKTARVKKWGVRVPEAVYNGVADDKRDDQIIQNAIIGRKSIGYLTPEYSIDTPGGQILDW